MSSKMGAKFNNFTYFFDFITATSLKIITTRYILSNLIDTGG